MVIHLPFVHFRLTIEDFDFDAFMRDDILITANCFNQNGYEYSLFMQYKRNQQMTTNQLRDNMLQYYQDNPSKLSNLFVEG